MGRKYFPFAYKCSLIVSLNEMMDLDKMKITLNISDKFIIFKHYTVCQTFTVNSFLYNSYTLCISYKKIHVQPPLIFLNKNMHYNYKNEGNSLIRIIESSFIKINDIFLCQRFTSYLNQCWNNNKVIISVK